MERFYVNNYLLDEAQTKIVYDDSKYLLVIAGAGSGKTLTIVGKVNYLTSVKQVKPEEILCISFTNDSVNSLREKINNPYIDIMTFHKLGINILNQNNIHTSVVDDNYLNFIIHEFFLGLVFESDVVMKNILKYFGKVFIFSNIDKQYRAFLTKHYKEILNLEKLLSKFVKLFKSNNYSINSFIRFKNRTIKKKEKLFLSIALNIYLIYENELKSSGKIDFDDMLTMSTQIIENGADIKKYKYIIIDEYQDTSYIRFLLIKSILNKTNASFMAVGDDFQSIYKFSGCDLSMFVNFKEYFSDSNILKIENTYRNSCELINAAGSFIMRNPYQIRKNLKSSKSIYKPIKICYNYSLKELIQMIGGNIMVLGRNNKDIVKYLDKDLYFHDSTIRFKDNTNINIKYFTIHRSKGLEEDNVIVLNVVDEIDGIPSRIEEDKIIRFVSKSSKYLYDEERRIFYVALTRTKNSVYLMSKNKKESIFIKEIIKYSKNIEILKKE